MGTDRKAFIFDTNFIIQNQKLDQALDKIKAKYSLYVAQVSIDERIAQRCRQLKTDYAKAEDCKTKYSRFAQIKIIRSYDETAQLYKEGIQAVYVQYFGSNIIPFAMDGENLARIISRANQKLPPFSSAENASDKGFKDCLLWLSLLDYFKDNGEDEIVFSTDDHGFIDNATFLCQEFKEVTGKTIEIKPNSSFKDLVKEKEVVVSVPKTTPLPDFSSLRDEIQNTIADLRWAPHEDRWGDTEWNKTYNISTMVDARYMEVVFSGLEYTVKRYILNKTLPASSVLDLDMRVTDFEEIPMSAIEACLKLYQRILSDYPEYVQQFYEACANVVNDSYVAPSTAPDDGLPF